MEKINCVITDDEPIAREIVLNYCNQLSFLHVVAMCSNALEAKAVLQREKVDLIFLDINMPVLDGLTFIKTLSQPPEIIFTNSSSADLSTATFNCFAKPMAAMGMYC